jgi:surface polysaccharide O-acyltransferase-like enzyme
MNGMDLPIAGSEPPMRDGFLDSLRGFAILGVICVHFGGSFAVSTNAWTPSFYVGLALSELFNIAVPLFILISGLLASPYRPHRNVGIGSYYLGRLLAIVWPYTIASVAAFFLLGGSEQYLMQGAGADRARWLFSRFFYYGIHPTFYFIPLILLLYFLKPALAWIGPAISELARKRQINVSTRRVLLAVGFPMLVAHILLGVLAYRNVVDFYTWCRPNPLFWMVYFYLGMILPEVFRGIPIGRIKIFVVCLIVIFALGYVADWKMLMDVTKVGQTFDHSNINYAYARPETMALNMIAVLFFSGLLMIGLAKQSAILSFIGRHSLHIYLWHLFVLYYIAWRYASVLDAVKMAPELILGFAVFTALVIAGLATILGFLFGLLGRYSMEVKFRRV